MLRQLLSKPFIHYEYLSSGESDGTDRPARKSNSHFCSTTQIRSSGIVYENSIVLLPQRWHRIEGLEYYCVSSAIAINGSTRRVIEMWIMSRICLQGPHQILARINWNMSSNRFVAVPKWDILSSAPINEKRCKSTCESKDKMKFSMALFNCRWVSMSADQRIR